MRSFARRRLSCTVLPAPERRPFVSVVEGHEPVPQRGYVLAASIKQVSITQCIYGVDHCRMQPIQGKVGDGPAPCISCGKHLAVTKPMQFSNEVVVALSCGNVGQVVACTSPLVLSGPRNVVVDSEAVHGEKEFCVTNLRTWVRYRLPSTPCVQYQQSMGLKPDLCCTGMLFSPGSGRRGRELSPLYQLMVCNTLRS